MDRQANLHLVTGKRSFGEQQLLENYLAIVDEILRAKPASSKCRYMLSITISTTMGPGIRVDPARVKDAELVSA